MVTYIDSKNASQYHILFDKATELLKEKKPQDIADIFSQFQMSWDTFNISTLNEYYAYLTVLKNLAKEDDEKKFFLRLPLDEDLFEIDANTREITVPEALSSVGVQGDELAEIVYFSIDRFFDRTDLADKDIYIAIQWEVTNLDGETIRGFSRNFGKDIETIPNKIIFGWPISHEITDVPGNIRFAVRFYSYDENNEFNYSLATLPATIRIQPSLDLDVISMREVDYGEQILSRVTSSGIYDKSLPMPGEPDIVKDLYVLYPAGYEDKTVIDLPENNQFTLAIGAQPSDIGAVGVDWRYFSYGNGEYSKDSTSLDPQKFLIEDDYLLVNETLNPDKIYYTASVKDEEIQYSRFTDLDSLESLNIQVIEHEDQEDEIGYKLADEDELIQLYEKIYKITVKVTEDFKATGIYTADVYSRALVNTKTKYMERAKGITIPGPLNPEISVENDQYFTDNPAIITDKDTLNVHIATDDDTFTLKVAAVTGESLKGESDAHVNLTYQWQKKNQNDEWVNVAHDSEEAPEELTISNLNLLSTLNDEYQAIVTSHRNGQVTSITSGVYRITPVPQEPDISIQFNKWEYSGVKPVWEKLKYNKDLPGENLKTMSLSDALKIRVDKNIQTDKLSYAWMYYNVQGPIDLTDDEITNTALEPLENKLGEIFGNPTHENDPSYTMDTIIKDLTEFSNNELITTEDGDSIYQSSITPDKTGFYYCVVINELNGHISAAATPIFQVTIQQQQ